MSGANLREIEYEVSLDPLKNDKSSIKVLGEIEPSFDKILSPEALHFIASLQKKFGSTRKKLLNQRQEVQSRIDSGEMPNFLRETQEIRESHWSVAPIPEEIQNRRVEITGPVDRKMVINALNSGAQVYMADFEDSHSPTWQGTIEGQMNLLDAVRNQIRLTTPEGKNYSLNSKTSVLFVRPRGWHLVEKHVLIDGEPISASLFDFGLYFFHNAHELLSQKKHPLFYLPKIESYLEARLWNEVFVYSQKFLNIPQGTIKATVLIETILAAFQMDEILFELKNHSAGLNCGRWDYIFSFIKKFRNYPNFVLPNRAQVTMDVHFLKSYCQLLIKTCHKREIHAMGGMAAQIPIKSDPEANEKALAKVAADKKREVSLGHDGTWVAHPGLIEVAKNIFDEGMPQANQIYVKRNEWNILSEDLLRVPTGEITEDGLRTNVNVAILYLESWLRGTGCVPLYHLMEDAATAEISRAQVWQWLKHGKVGFSDFNKIFDKELLKIRTSVGEEKFEIGKFEKAGQLFKEIVTGTEFVEFITLPAYAFL